MFQIIRKLATIKIYRDFIQKPLNYFYLKFKINIWHLKMILTLFSCVCTKQNLRNQCYTWQSLGNLKLGKQNKAGIKFLLEKPLDKQHDLLKPQKLTKPNKNQQSYN